MLERETACASPAAARGGAEHTRAVSRCGRPGGKVASAAAGIPKGADCVRRVGAEGGRGADAWCRRVLTRRRTKAPPRTHLTADALAPPRTDPTADGAGAAAQSSTADALGRGTARAPEEDWKKGLQKGWRGRARGPSAAEIWAGGAWPRAAACKSQGCSRVAAWPGRREPRNGWLGQRPHGRARASLSLGWVPLPAVSRAPRAAPGRPGGAGGAAKASRRAGASGPRRITFDCSIIRLRGRRGGLTTPSRAPRLLAPTGTFISVSAWRIAFPIGRWPPIPISDSLTRARSETPSARHSRR